MSHPDYVADMIAQAYKDIAAEKASKSVNEYALELTLDLCRAVIATLTNAGLHHYAKPLRDKAALLTHELSLVEASEMVDPFNAA